MLRGQVGRQFKGSFDLDFDHQATLGSLVQSADMGCFICNRIWEDMPIGYNRSEFSLRPKRAFVAAHIELVHRGLYRLDFTLSGHLAAKHYAGTLLLQQTASNSETRVYTPQSRWLNSPEVLRLARSWIAKCIGPDHKYCPNSDFSNRFPLQSGQSTEETPTSPIDTSGVIPLTKRTTLIELSPPFYPTRLIELGSVDSPTVKLIVTRNATHPNDDNSREPEGQYVTLSHCWGNKGPHFCLIESNLDVFQRSGIPLKELPRTFQNAIDFARRLSSNVKYIWIDSLCIIQKNEADWLRESTRMYQVYRNSYCNISATAAINSSQPLYVERDPQHLWGNEVNFNTEDVLKVGAELQRSRDPQGHEALIQRCSIVDPSLWQRKVESAPVNTRAWVLQERLLAPRVLHFCEDQIAWECRELDASESAATGIARDELKNGTIRDRVRLKGLVAPEYGPKLTSNSQADFAFQAHQNWKLIIERYSLTNLTKAKDKLIALAGIAEQMSTQVGAPYVAGMWGNKYFASQLLWRVEPQFKNQKFLYPSRRPKFYRAPSFSWAAIDAPQGIHCGETQEEEKLLIKVTEVDVHPEPQPNSKFGLVKEGGYLKLECQKLPILIETKSRKTEEGLREDVYTWKLVRDEERDSKMHPNVYLDSPEDDFEQIRDRHSGNSMWLVPAYKRPNGDLVSLLLQKKDNHNHFQRVGLSVIPRYVSLEREIMEETSVDENGHFKRVGKEVIKIV